jgi:hypothetical protein
VILVSSGGQKSASKVYSIRENLEVFYGTQYQQTVVQWYWFFQFFIMGKMVIFLMYIFWKKFPRCQGYIKRLDFIYYNKIILYISDKTHVPPIPHMNTTHTTLKNRWYRIDLNYRILIYICPFKLIRLLFNRWYKVVLCTVKNLKIY